MIRTTRASSHRDQKKCRHTRALLNGVDVSSRCFYADNRRGVVGLYKLNAEGKKYIEHQYFEHWAVPSHLRPRVAREWLRGKVTIGRAA